MKLNRLLEITTVLLNKRTVTAAELASRFGVSTRTIYRDIDVLSASGVPVYATQGTRGGISVMEDYTISRAALSDKERESILFALQSLQATKYPEVDTVLEKLGSMFKHNSSDWITVDFSPWGSDPNAHDKFTDIKSAILHTMVIEIDYINALNKKSTREIEPLRLMFKGQAWYLWGFCLEKQDYRMFRISRIKRVRITNRLFDRKNVHIVDMPESETDYHFVHLVLEFNEAVLFRLYDDFDDNFIKPMGNGTYRIEFDFPEDEWVYGFILSFGSNVRVIEPEHIRGIIRERAEKIVGLYKPTV